MQTTQPMTPFDKRAQRTKNAIKASFKAIMRSKPLCDVTVKEVMEQAGVNRATFYSHYSNLEELAADIEVSCASQVRAEIDSELQKYSSPTTEDAIGCACDILLADRESCLWIAGSRATGRGRKILREHCAKHWAIGKPRGRATDELVFSIFFDGAIALLGRWATGDAGLEEIKVKNAIMGVVRRLSDC